MVPDQHQRVTSKRERVEQQERPALAPVVGQPAARISVHRAQQCLQGVEQTDDEDGRAKGFEVFRCKTQPQALAGSCQDQRHEQQRRVSAQREEPYGLPPSRHLPDSPSPATLQLKFEFMKTSRLLIRCLPAMAFAGILCATVLAADAPSKTTPAGAATSGTPELRTPEGVWKPIAAVLGGARLPKEFKAPKGTQLYLVGYRRQKE